MKFTFTDKTSYLNWRQQWREQYAQLTADIRKLKRGRKMYLRTYERYETSQGKARRLVSKIQNPEFDLVGDLGALRFAAAYQMELLAEAKVLSWQMKLGNKGVSTSSEAPIVESAPVAETSTGFFGGLVGGMAKLLKA